MNPLLPDSFTEIMIHMDIDTLTLFYRSNKHLHTLFDNNFWLNKFDLDNLPLLFEINNKNVKLMSGDMELNNIIVDNLPKQPTTIPKWIKLYKDTIFYLGQAEQLIDDIGVTHHFEEFNAPEINFNSLLWLPVKWFQIAYNNPKNTYEIQFDLTDNYDILLWENNFNDNGVIDVMHLTKEEMILFIAKLIYFNLDCDQDEFLLASEDDGLYIQNLIKNTSFFNMYKPD